MPAGMIPYGFKPKVINHLLCVERGFWKPVALYTGIGTGRVTLGPWRPPKSSCRGGRPIHVCRLCTAEIRIDTLLLGSNRDCTSSSRARTVASAGNASPAGYLGASQTSRHWCGVAAIYLAGMFGSVFCAARSEWHTRGACTSSGLRHRGAGDHRAGGAVRTGECTRMRAHKGREPQVEGLELQPAEEQHELTVLDKLDSWKMDEPESPGSNSVRHSCNELDVEAQSLTSYDDALKSAATKLSLLDDFEVKDPQQPRPPSKALSKARFFRSKGIQGSNLSIRESSLLEGAEQGKWRLVQGASAVLALSENKKGYGPSLFNSIWHLDTRSLFKILQMGVIHPQRYEAARPMQVDCCSPKATTPNVISFTARLCWDGMIALLVLYSAFEVPFRISFLSIEYERSVSGLDGFDISDVVIDTIFLIDLISNFFTGYLTVRDEVVIMDRRRIAIHYVQTWFLVDLVSSFPFYAIFVGSGRAIALLPRTIKLLRLARLLRLLRVSKLLRLARHWQDRLKVSGFMLDILKLLSTVVIFVHWNTCAQFLVPALMDFPEDSWVVLNDLEFASNGRQYSYALFRVLSHMLSIGYGVQLPHNLAEPGLLADCSGASMFAVICGMITTILISANESNTVHRLSIERMNRYMAQHQIPLELRDRIRDTYQYRWNTKRGIEEEQILSELPRSLNTEVRLHRCRDLIKCCSFFYGTSDGFIASLVTCFHPVVFLKDSIMMREDEVARDMFFILDGKRPVLGVASA
eukprot:scaffold2003_cov420-Prasinococcus_capsulatus_cf.AAC.5